MSAGDLESGVKVHVFKCWKRKRKEGKGRGRGRERGVQRGNTPGHTGCVLALAVSSDGKFLVSQCHKLSIPVMTIMYVLYLKVSGGKGGTIHVWDPETNGHIHKFTGHRDTVSVSISSPLISFHPKMMVKFSSHQFLHIFV